MPKLYFAALTRNKTSLVGSALLLGALTLIFSLVAIQFLGLRGGAYLGIITFLALPLVAFVGLVLVLIGIRRARTIGPLRDDQAVQMPYPVLDFNRERTRKAALGLVVLTTVAVVILAGATFKGVKVMDSREFCGESCHTVMQPESVAHQRSPHARVNCVDCHIGPGAGWFVKSKLSGAWQVVAVALELYPTPIPTPIENLRPSRETCEQCHWPTTFFGDLLKVKSVYTDDEANTELKTAVLLKVGGLAGRESSGIHWHVNPDIEVRYRASPDRQTIYDVELKRADGSTELFTTGDIPEDAGPWRLMDCIDCHNRPTHRYSLPMDEVDSAMASGYMDKTLPYLKRESMRVLRTEYAGHEEAAAAIRREISGFYEQNYPEIAAAKDKSIEKSIRELTLIYTSNVFPKMKVTWGTYPDNSKHFDSPGCWRCHDRKHKTEDGKRISRDCGLCHTILAQEEENPEILEVLNP